MRTAWATLDLPLWFFPQTSNTGRESFKSTSLAPMKFFAVIAETLI
jgi:hypothetical protein